MTSLKYHAILGSDIRTGCAVYLLYNVWRNQMIYRRNLTDHKSLVPDPPQKNWRVFPSYDIPSLFNYGHIVCVAKSRLLADFS